MKPFEVDSTGQNVRKSEKKIVLWPKPFDKAKREPSAPGNADIRTLLEACSFQVPPHRGKKKKIRPSPQPPPSGEVNIDSP